jgi:hypothetical protein
MINIDKVTTSVITKNDHYCWVVATGVIAADQGKLL